MLRVSEWSSASNVLVVRLDSLGDVLMTTPAIHALKTSQPDRRITLLTSPSGASLAPYLDDVDETLVYQAPWMKATPPRSSSQVDLDFVGSLRQRSFDAAVIFTVYSQNPLAAALMCYLAEIPLRTAYCRENPYQLLTHWVPESEPQGGIRHEVQRHLDLAAETGSTAGDQRMRFGVPAQDYASVDRLLEQAGLQLQQPWVVVHAGATAPSRMYPLEGFSEVIDTLAAHGIQAVLTGSRQESGLIGSLWEMTGRTSILTAGRLSLGELAAVIDRSSVLISNNTGPVHLAAALGTPVVDLYALTNPQHTPWQVPHVTLSFDVPCKFCYKSICPEGHHNCLAKVAPAWVVEAALGLIAGDNQETILARLPIDRLFTQFPSVVEENNSFLSS